MAAKPARRNQKFLAEAIRFIRSQTSITPRTALILGSGLGDFADRIHNDCTIPTENIPGYPATTVQGHAGKLVFGTVYKNGSRSKPLLVFKGRIHFYESGSLSQALFPVEIAHRLGCKILVVTNAAGGVNRQFQAGDLMLIRDFINMTNLYPTLFGITSRSPSARLPSESRNYFDSKLQDIVRTAAKKARVALREGVYCWLKGPSYETAAEIRMFSAIGADAVGMSTVPEIIVAKELGMRVVAISLISNLATGISSGKLSHAEVTETADRVRERFTDLMQEIVSRT